MLAQISLAQKLSVSAQHLVDQINQPVYKSFTIPKRRGRRRIIQPSPELMHLQRRLAKHLIGIYSPFQPECVFGFTSRPLDWQEKTYCNLKQNAIPHIGKNVVLNLDLQQFFPSINAKTILETLVKQPFNLDGIEAELIALLATVNGSLPIGAPSSPIISNMVSYQLDLALLNYCHNNGLTYTRYADDLTFSSMDEITNLIINELSSVIAESGFKLNEKKIKLKTKHVKQTVTGLTVNQKVNVSRDYLKTTRTMIYTAKNKGIETARKLTSVRLGMNFNSNDHFYNYLLGRVNFISQILSDENRLVIRFYKDLDFVKALVSNNKVN